MKYSLHILITYCLIVYSCQKDITNFSKTTHHNTLINPRYDFAYELIDDNVYVFGGFCDNSSTTVTNNKNCAIIEQFNINSKFWIECGELNQVQMGCNGTLVNNNIYLFGHYPCSDVLQKFNLDNEFVITENTGIDLYNPNVITFDDNVLIIGGLCIDGSTDNLSIISYKTAREEFSNVSTLPESLHMPSDDYSRIRSLINNGILYIWSKNILLTYDTATNHWRRIESAKGWTKYSQEGIVRDNKLILFGGADYLTKGSFTYNDVSVFNIDNGEWKLIENVFNQNRHYRFGLIESRDTFYIFGGRNPDTWEPLSSFEIITNLNI